MIPIQEKIERVLTMMSAPGNRGEQVIRNVLHDEFTENFDLKNDIIKLKSEIKTLELKLATYKEVLLLQAGKEIK